MNEPIQIAPQAAQPFPVPQPPKLPTLVRTTALMSPDTHAAQIKEAAGNLGSSEPAILSALSVQRQMAEAAAALERIRQTRNPADTAHNHLKKAADAYKTMLSTAANRHDMARASVKARLAQVESQIAETLGLHESRDAAEIRTALRSMSKEDRSKAVEAAIQAKDGAILAAVFNSRELVTGIPETQRNSFRRRAEELHASDLLKLRVGLEQAGKLVSDAFDNLADMENQVGAVGPAKSELERQIEAADNAWLAFNQAIQ